MFVLYSEKLKQALNNKLLKYQQTRHENTFVYAILLLNIQYVKSKNDDENIPSFLTVFVNDLNCAWTGVKCFFDAWSK